MRISALLQVCLTNIVLNNPGLLQLVRNRIAFIIQNHPFFYGRYCRKYCQLCSSNFFYGPIAGYGSTSVKVFSGGSEIFEQLKKQSSQKLTGA
ncbi:MAG: hypothetical protein ABI168_08910 [Ginsengibacter sp.]